MESIAKPPFTRHTLSQDQTVVAGKDGWLEIAEGEEPRVQLPPASVARLREVLVVTSHVTGGDRLSNLMELLPEQEKDANRWYYELRKQDSGWVCACTSGTATAERWNNVGATPEEAVTKMLARLGIRVPTCRIVDPDLLPDEVLNSLLEEYDLEDIETMSTDEAWQQYLEWHGIIGYDEQLRKAFEGIVEASRWPLT